MNRPTILPALAAAALCAASLAPTAALAADIAIRDGWSRPTPPSAPTAVGYLTVVNTGKAADRLIALSSPAAAQVQVHSMSMTGGIMRMRQIEGGLPIPGHGQATLGPDGDHLMFIGLKRPFKAGERIPVTLTFAHAGRAQAMLVVKAADDATPSMPAMPGMNMGGH